MPVRWLNVIRSQCGELNTIGASIQTTALLFEISAHIMLGVLPRANSTPQETAVLKEQAH